MNRAAQFIEIIGRPRTGKTTFLKDVINHLKASGQRILLVDPDGTEPAWFDVPEIDLEINPKELLTFKGVAKVIYEEKVTFKALLEAFASGKLQDFQLILDDANFYADSNPEPELRKILKRKRQYGIDIYSTAHGFTEVPPMFFTFITMYVMFATDDDIERRKKNIPCFEQQLMNTRFVNSQAQKQPHYHAFFNSRGEKMEF